MARIIRHFSRPLVSVIVPVYKVEAYIELCLDSLRKQTLSNIEILLIDDASPDKSGQICETYAQRDTRFKVFHNKENQGLSVARNIGIANSSSDFLMFVDSDDYVHEDFCKDAYNCAVYYDAELVIFRFHKILREGYQKHNKKHVKANFNLCSGYKTQMEAIDLLRKGIVGDYAWNKLYRRELFHNIKYPAGYLFEDVGTTYKLVLASSRIYFLDKFLYFYCYRNDSITEIKTEKYLSDQIKMSLQQYHDLKDWGYSADRLDAFLNNVALDYCMKKKPDIYDNNYMYCVNVLQKCKKIPTNLTYKRKLLFLLFKCYRPMFELVCNLYNIKIC